MPEIIKLDSEDSDIADEEHCEIINIKQSQNDK